jgi:hypothetical protein
MRLRSFLPALCLWLTRSSDDGTAKDLPVFDASTQAQTVCDAFKVAASIMIIMDGMAWHGMAWPWAMVWHDLISPESLLLRRRMAGHPSHFS